MSEEHSYGIEAIIQCVSVAAHYNPTLEGLVENLQTYATDTLRVRSQVANAVSTHSGVYEALDNVSPGLATCVHDFVYMVVAPLQSITTRDAACEHVAKEILDL